MLSIFRLALIAVIVSVGFIPAVAVGGETSHDEKAIELLREFSKTLTDAKTIKTTFDLEMVLEVNGQIRRNSSRSSFDFRRPNLLAWVLRGGNGGTVKCDGDKLFVLIPNFKQYTQEQAPANFDNLSDTNVLSFGVGKDGIVEVILSGDPFGMIMQDVNKASYQGIEEIEGVSCHVIKLSTDEIDRYIYLPIEGKPLPVFVRYDVSRLFAKNFTRGSEVPEVKAEFSFTIGKWTLDAEIPDSIFKFKPPADAKKVDTFGSSGEGEHPMVGKAAPDFELDLLDGGKVKLSDHKGKDIVILDFWATWCGPCRRAMPILVDVASRYAKRGVVFYAVNLREAPDVIKSFMQQNKVKMPVALDTTSEVAELYGVEGIPQTVIIDTNGKIQAIHSGFSLDMKARLEKELNAILDGEGPAGEK